MSEATTDIIPLPESLKLCGCPGAERGRHLTSCIPAREHDAIPLSERDGYVQDADGRSNRFQGISWEFPMRFSADLHVEVEMDPVAWFTKHLESYRSFEMEPGFEDWEKPLQFVVREMEDAYMGFGGWGRYIAQDSSYMDDVDTHPRWEPADTDRLHQALGITDEPPEPEPEPVDPNQGSLLD